MGYWGISSIEDDVDEVGVIRLPSVDSLRAIAAEAQNIRGSLRTLTISGLPQETRTRQYDNLAASRQRYEEAWAIYEPLPQSAEEAEVWNKFVPAWNAWRTENNRFLELSRRLDEYGVANPNEFKAFIEQFTKDHYMLVQRTLHQLHMGEEHREGLITQPVILEGGQVVFKQLILNCET
jgi:methyl-accepting chemotaxis protein